MKKLFTAFLFLSLIVSTPVFAKDIISVLYFDNTTGNKDFEWLRKAIADMLISDISESSEIEVVERENLQKVIQEQKLVLAGLVDEDQAVKIGQMLNAKKLVYGSFVVNGQSVRIDGKITDSESGKILGTFSSSGIVKNILTVQNDLAGKVLTAMGIKKPAALAQPLGYSFEAVKSYYEGLDLLDQGIAEEALKKFQEASKLDPSYLKPYDGIEESYKFLQDFKLMRYQKEINEKYYQIYQVQQRLKETPWKTFGDIISDPDYKAISAKDADAAFKKYYAYYQGDTPAQVTWNLQNLIMELGDLYEEYFEDFEKSKELQQEIINIADKAAPQFKNDKFLPEILYMELLARVHMEQWDIVKKKCEYLMVNFGEYRMMWAIEDFYARALEKLKEK